MISQSLFSQSIYGDSFNDENFILRHTQPGKKNENKNENNAYRVWKGNIV